VKEASPHEEMLETPVRALKDGGNGAAQLPASEPSRPAASTRPPVSVMICSMTGYARVTSRAADGPALTLTLKSINHRFLDLQLRLPAGAEALEATIRAELKRSLARGHIECTLTLDRNGRKEAVERRPVAVAFDVPALRSYVASFRAAAEELGLASEPDLNLAAHVPGLLLAAAESRPEAEAEEADALQSALSRDVPALLSEALAALKVMRAHEGAALAAMLRECLDRLSLLAYEVAGLRAGVQDAHSTRLAERGDVEEEVARMHTHIAHFRELLGAGGEVGKKLDFLLQEMNREANTLLSKTAGMTGGSARITECGLAMKAEVEKLREQVQNLE
jgi:uncharacterized protein (TIGR00255 family)